MNAVALAALLLAGRLQDAAEHRSYTIPKQERSSYVPALQKFRDAEGMLADPPECVKRCGELLDDKSIREIHRDARLRIENTDGSYGDWTVYAPYQLRGRAYLTRAEALAPRDRREAAEQIRLAVADLEESVRRGLKSSDEFLGRARKLALQLRDTSPVPNEKAAEAERRLVDIRKLVDQKSPPETVLQQCEAAAALLQGTPYEREWRYIRAEAFLLRWTGHAEAGRYRSARAAVAALGGFLTEIERTDVLSKIDEKSRDAARRFQTALRDLLPDQETWMAFHRVPAADVERRLALPPVEELDPADAGLIWARRCRERLLRIGEKATLPAAPIEDFLQVLNGISELCVEAAEGENRALPALEALLQDLAVGRLEKTLEGASAEEPEGLARRRQESARIVEAVDALAGRLGKDQVVSRHLAEIRAIPDRLPIDPPQLDDLGRKLLDPSNPKGLWGRSPDLALELEGELAELDRTQGARLSRIARRKLYTYLMVSRIARLLLSGVRAEDVARREELQALSRKVQLDGGPMADVMALVSPRVRAVVERLKS